jgi:hypothetical protein
MKKVFFALALLTTVLVSCNKVTTTVDSTTDSTVAVVDSVQVDSTVVSDDEARDYLKDAIK